MKKPAARLAGRKTQAPPGRAWLGFMSVDPLQLQTSTFQAEFNWESHLLCLTESSSQNALGALWPLVDLGKKFPPSILSISPLTLNNTIFKRGFFQHGSKAWALKGSKEQREEISAIWVSSLRVR